MLFWVLRLLVYSHWLWGGVGTDLAQFLIKIGRSSHGRCVRLGVVHLYVLRGKTKHKQSDQEYFSTYIKTAIWITKKHTYPVDEEGLCELDHLQSDQQADGDQVVVQDDECQQVVGKVSGDVTCTNTQYSLNHWSSNCALFLIIHLVSSCEMWYVSGFSPARDRYQQDSSVCSMFQMAAPTELTRAMTSRMPNRTRICMLVTRSTLERFSGALVEFWEVKRSMNTTN